VPQLGILGVDLNAGTGAMTAALRTLTGVIVVGRTETADVADTGLVAGDAICAINGTTVLTVDGLVSALRGLEPHRPIVLQVEREGKLTFITFEIE